MGVRRFFKLDPAEERRLKMGLAVHLNHQYDAVNMGEPSAVPIDGVAAYRPDVIGDLHKKYLDATSAGTPAPDATVATVISALFVKWCAPGKVFNVGYVSDWISKNSASWDSSIERRAGGLQAQTPYGAQRLTLSNQSSLFGLIALGVKQYLHGKVDDHIATALKSIRVMLFLGAESEDVELLNANENIAKEEYKRHSELENVTVVQLWCESMRAAGSLDPTKALDVFKFSAILGDPRQATPAWLSKLVGSVAPTWSNKVKAIMKQECNLNWLKQNKVQALDILMADIWSELGKQGLAHKPFPITRAIWVSPEILTTAAFSTTREKEAVPPCRDGQAGEQLHIRMAQYAARRVFEFRMKHKTVDAFSSAPAWVAFARLLPFIESVLQSEYGPDMRAWPDQATALHKQLWVGELDSDLIQVSTQIPGHFDARHSEIVKLLTSVFTPLQRTMKAVAAAKATRVTEQPPPPPLETASAGDGDEGGSGMTEKTGDVTNELAAGLDLAEKKKLVSDLNKQAQAISDRDKSLQRQIDQRAAEIIRNRVVVMRSSTEAKHWMESRAPGYVARAIVVDFAMAGKLDSGPNGVHKLREQLAGTHEHLRSICVPVQESEEDGEGSSDAGGGSDKQKSQLDEDFLNACDPHLMDEDQLKVIFGDKAKQVESIMFQRASRITSEADFIPVNDVFKVALGARSQPRAHRKGQAHPTVYIEVLRSALNCSPIPLSDNEVAVVMTGGAPEAVVAAIARGYKHVLVVTHDDNEKQMLHIPPLAEEREFNIDYAAYSSPDPMGPLKGMLAACAVRMLYPFIANFLHRRPGHKVEPPGEMHIPPLETFTFIPLAGAIVARHVGEGAPDAAAATGKTPNAKKAVRGAAESPSAATPGTGKSKGADQDEEDGEENEIEDDAGDNGDEEEDDITSQLQKLEELEKGSSGKKPGKRGVASGGGGGPGKKKPRASAKPKAS
ncbi:unnamed protein product [Prorocentrum cordatum]|uniref:Uncharacterized protein n=1 Tax=Prorocentrum cordatum TaxID=2364126 RepID=A0ABN9PMG8_9DINO|nr:unnamed protein product [Polarella glacialis]